MDIQIYSRYNSTRVAAAVEKKLGLISKVFFRSPYVLC